MRLQLSRFGEGWAKMANLQVMLNLLQNEFEALPRRLATMVARHIKTEATSSKLAPNSVATIILKGSSTPLIDTGSLLESIIVRKEAPFTYYGGINPSAKNQRGVSQSVVALKQNMGYIIPVTDSIRKLFIEHGMTVSPNTQFFVVPARPFLTEAFRKADIELEKERAHTGLKITRSLGW